jgi:hypothetical protein
MNVQERVGELSQTIEQGINRSLMNPYIMAVVKLTLLIYAARIAPRLPDAAQKALENTYVKMFLITLIVYLSEKDFQLALILAVVYVMAVNFISGRGFLESFANYSSEYKKHFTGELIEPKTVIYPGCLNMTMADLENAFGGDQEKLTKTVTMAFKELLASAKDKNAKEKLMQMAYYTGLPYNMKFNEENAPYIATILVYRGFDLGSVCHPPRG